MEFLVNWQRCFSHNAAQLLKSLGPLIPFFGVVLNKVCQLRNSEYTLLNHSEIVTFNVLVDLHVFQTYTLNNRHAIINQITLVIYALRSAK